jgi:hypothetical protein
MNSRKYTKTAGALEEIIMRAEFGPGKYYLGDICYVLQDAIYKIIWGKKYNYEEGQFTLTDDGIGECIESFAVASTAYGDGEYVDLQGRKYPVDAGVIGIVPALMWKITEELIKKNALGTVLDIKQHLIFEAEGGIFTITADDEKIVIDTELDEDWEGWER